jgi:hypothetical protein
MYLHIKMSLDLDKTESLILEQRESEYRGIGVSVEYDMAKFEVSMLLHLLTITQAN